MTTTASSSNNTTTSSSLDKQIQHFSCREGNIVTRLFYVNELQKNSGIPHFIAIAYHRNEETGETLYGAAIYRQDPDKTNLPAKKWLRETLRSTAFSRLEKKPVILQLNADSMKELHKKIRQALYKYGVRDQTKKNSD